MLLKHLVVILGRVAHKGPVVILVAKLAIQDREERLEVVIQVDRDRVVIPVEDKGVTQGKE